MPEHHGNVQAKRAEALAGRKAIADVVTEQKFQRRAPSFVDFLGLALDHHARCRLGAAGGHKLAVDFHEADLAGVQRAALLQEAQGWNVQT